MSLHSMDGALLAIGALQPVLVKKVVAAQDAHSARIQHTQRPQDPYKSQLEALLTAHVVPLFESPWGHLRAKACWIAGQFSDIAFADGPGARVAEGCCVLRRAGLRRAGLRRSS